MKHISAKKLAVASLVTGSLLAGGYALAGPGGDCDKGGKGGYFGKSKHGFGGQWMGGPGQFMKGMRGLDLSADQKKAMIDIQENYKPQFESLRERMQEARQGVMDAMTSGSDLETAAQNQAELVKEMIILGGQVKTEVQALLTDEQKAKIQEKMEKRKEWREKRMERQGSA